MIVSKEVFHDGIRISTVRRPVETHLNDKGDMISSWVPLESDGTSCFTLHVRLIRCILVAVVFIALILLIKSPKVTMFLICILHAVISAMLIGSTVFRLLFKERSSTARYHAALHQVQNAYHELKRVPTLEEARKFPMICSDCILFKHFGIITEWFVMSMVAPMAYTNSSPWNFIIFIVFYFIWVFNFDKWYKKYKYMQILNNLALSKPTDKELLVVIECLTLAEAELNSFVHSDYIITPIDPSALSGN